MELLIEMDRVKKYFVIREGLIKRRYRYIRAVDDVSLSIGKGETFGIVGESGSGKTTLARLIPRLINVTAGTVRFAGIDVGKSSGSELMRVRRRMGIVFQDPASSLNPRATVGASIQRPLQLAGVPAKEAAKITREIAEFVNLGFDALDRYPHQLSGGQQQRASIARAIVLKPEFLILDEPTSALDVSVQAQILNLLVDLQREFNLTYLFISHNLSVVRYICDRIAVMYLGKLVELAPTRELYRRPLHPYSVALLSASPALSPRFRNRQRFTLIGDPPSLITPPKGCRLHPRCEFATEQCRMEEPEFVEYVPGHFAACHRARGLNLDPVARCLDV